MEDRVRELIAHECDSIKTLLLEKNASYGNSAMDPINIFSKLGAEEALKVRIDDKLRRIRNGTEYRTEDTEQDIIGYLILLRVFRATKPMETSGLYQEMSEKPMEKVFVKTNVNPVGHSPNPRHISRAAKSAYMPDGMTKVRERD